MHYHNNIEIMESDVKLKIETETKRCYLCIVVYYNLLIILQFERKKISFRERS